MRFLLPAQHNLGWRQWPALHLAVLALDVGKMGGKRVVARWEEGKTKVVMGGNGRKIKPMKERDKEREERRFIGDMDDKGK